MNKHAVALVALVTLVVACGPDAGDAPAPVSKLVSEGRVISGEAGWVEYRPTAKFIEEVPGYGGVANIERKDDGTEIFRFDFTGETVHDVVVEPGDVIIGQLDLPYHFRKVVASWTEGDVLVVTTAAAVIGDAVHQADVHVFVPFKPGEDPIPLPLSEVPEEGAPTGTDEADDEREGTDREPVTTGQAPPIPAVPGAGRQFETTASGLTFVDRTFRNDYRWVPFTLAGRELFRKRRGPAEVTVRAASGSRFELRGGYTVRLKITHRRAYFRAEARGGVGLDLNIAADLTAGGTWAESRQFWPRSGSHPLVRFSIFGIPAYLGLRVEGTYGMRGRSGTVTLTTGYHLDRGFTSYVEYNRRWRRGSGSTGSGSRLDPVGARYDGGVPSVDGINVGVRPRLELGLGGTYSRRWAGLTASAGVNVHVNPYVDLGTAFSTREYDLDICVNAGVGVTAELSAFLQFKVWRWKKKKSFRLGRCSHAWDLYSRCWDVRSGRF